MFTAEQLNNYAEVLLWGMKAARGNKFSPGEIVLIRYDLGGQKLAEILFEKLLTQGLNPIPRITISSKMEQAFFEKANSSQLTFIPPGDEELVKNLNGTISLLSPESLTHLQEIEPERIGKTVLAKKKLRDILDLREQQGLFGWTLCLLTTPELASTAGLSPEEYTEQIIKACYLDQADPIGKWKEIYNQALEIKNYLNSLQIESVRLESERCDLVVTPGQERQWIGVSGHNIPSFELFISPDWRGTQGVYYMNLPSYRNGNLVKDLRLEFNHGIVSRVQANQGEEFVKKLIQLDTNADKLGEFSLTDKQFSRIDKFMAHTLYDENFGGEFGNSHIALGASYIETYAKGGKNLDEENKEKLGFNDSALHWDLVNTEPKTVTAKLRTGKTKKIYENGSFIL